MRHIRYFFLASNIFVFVNSCASFPQHKLENQADKIAVETKTSLTQELTRVFAFFKNSEKKLDKIMYRTREDIDAIIYDAQKQYYEQGQN